MRLYEFKSKTKNIDVIVVTDGIKDQKKVFITETPRGPSVPGAISTVTNPNDQILAMGFNFVAGTEREHLDFMLFALKNNLQLLQWNGGLNEASIEIIPENLTYNFTITTTPTTLSFIKEGETKSFTVNSIKTVTTEGPLKGMIVPVKYNTTITGTGFSLNNNKDAVIASINAGALRNGTVTVTQLEGTSKTATVALSQAAGV